MMTLSLTRRLPTALAACVLMSTTAMAQDEPRSSNTVVDTRRGPVTINRSIVPSDDGRTGSVVVQGEQGKTATRNFTRNYVRGEGVSSTSTATGPNSRSRTTERSARRVGRGEVERGRQVTGPRGNERPTRRWVRSRRPN